MENHLGYLECKTSIKRGENRMRIFPTPDKQEARKVSKVEAKREKRLGLFKLIGSESPEENNLKCPCCTHVSVKTRQNVLKHGVSCDNCGYSVRKRISITRARKLEGFTVNGYKILEYLYKSRLDGSPCYSIEKDGVLLPYELSVVNIFNIPGSGATLLKEEAVL